MKSINIPERFDRDTFGPLIEELQACRDAPEITVDFAYLRYSFPTAMLVVGSALRRWATYRRSRGYNSSVVGVDQAISVHSYLMHMGFFDFIFLPYGKKVGQASGSPRYLPIRCISRPNIDVTDTASQEFWYGSIQEQARQVGGLLARSFDDTQELRTYTYTLREVLRNVFEHSGSTECFICGQRWYNGWVEIAIVDEGIGIRTSLERAHRTDTDAEALSFAVRPGISRTNGLEHDLNVYDNSGFGLYVLSQLAASFGWFALGSGGSRLIGYRQERTYEPSWFEGTYLGIRLTSTPRNFQSVLTDIIQVGEEEAKVSGIITRASGRTRLAML